MEEQLDLVLNDYVELESDLLSMAVRWMVAVYPKYEYVQRERNLIVNRRLSNLLSACRGYLDHAPQRIDAIRFPSDGASFTSEDFKCYARKQYDEFLGYRVMEALRNDIQHAGFPFAITYDSAWEGEDASRKLRFTAKPYIEVALLGKKFKPAVRRELEQLGDKVPVMPMVRQYVASIGDVHETVRKAVQSHAEEWESLVLGAMAKLKDVDPERQTLGLVAVKVAEDGAWVEKAELYDKPIEYRRELEQRNRNLSTLAYRYVSSEKL